MPRSPSFREKAARTHGVRAKFRAVARHRMCNAAAEARTGGAEAAPPNQIRRSSAMSSDFEGGALRAYRQNLASLSPLDRETERELVRRWRAGDKRAGDKIVEACLPFVLTIALEYRRWGVPLEDVIQQGNVGLLRAAQKFDPDRECRLATYAAYWIRAEIREYVVRAFRVVRLGTTKAERRALRAYRSTRETSAAKLAAVSGLSEERVERLLPLLRGREVSLDAQHDELGPAIDRLPGRAPSPEEDSAAQEVRTLARGSVRKAMDALSDREKLIVEARMMSDEPATLQQLGDRLGVSKERVRQLEERARGKLREQLQEVWAEAS
jgi:RNA polymerase sigma-32 factor